MSAIDDLKGKLANLEISSKIGALVPKSSGWLSRKLITTLSVAGVVVYLGHDNIVLALYGVIVLGVAYLVTQAAHDIFQSRDDRIIRVAIIEALARDGLTPDELSSVRGLDSTKSPVS